MIKFYGNDYSFNREAGDSKTTFSIVDNDTFSEASKHENVACLNFASHKRPGGGYVAVRNLRMPIKTQEEDLFRRSDLPEIMDNAEIRKHYPLYGLKSLYCTTTVNKDKKLDEIEPFETSIITVAAVVNPKPDDYGLVRDKIDRILDIAADQKHKNLILGAWGCGVFNNDPKQISSLFKKRIESEFKGVFEKVIFAIPGKGSQNYRIFESAITVNRR